MPQLTLNWKPEESQVIEVECKQCCGTGIGISPINIKPAKCKACHGKGTHKVRLATCNGGIEVEQSHPRYNHFRIVGTKTPSGELSWLASKIIDDYPFSDLPDAIMDKLVEVREDEYEDNNPI